MKNIFALLILIIISHVACKQTNLPDLILVNGKIVTLDSNSAIAEAVSVSKGKIDAVGTTREIKKLAGKETKVIDLKGKTVVPGLIDSHLHPESASVSELVEKIPDLHTVAQVLKWVKEQAASRNKGEWIIMPKLFSTRLIEMRYPNLTELDNAAPENPVFLNGSFGGMINSAAMKISGISRKTENPGILKDKKTGLPTGIIRASAFNLLKTPPQKTLTVQEKEDALVSMLAKYNRYGITSVFSGSGDFESVKLYQDLSAREMLTTRIYQNILLPTDKHTTEESARSTISAYKQVTGSGDEWVRIGSLKVFMDGGILTGTAYMREPWGDKAGDIFGIEDTSYRGIINFSHDDLLAIVKAANDYNWSFTVHATGGGSVDMILDIYNEVNKIKSINGRRFSIIHGNFYTPGSISLMKNLGVLANSQAAWFYKDADAMKSILGEERMKDYHPNRALIDAGVTINGGSDHMVGWDADASINPYNPFLAMWAMVTRKTERGPVMTPEQAVIREEALRMYTVNNAFASFEESIKGTIEPGKLADFAVLTDDILNCPEDKIREIEAAMTIVGGKVVYDSGR